MVRTLLLFSLSLVLSTLLPSAAVVADEVPLKENRFNRRGAKDGKAFSSRHWKAAGGVFWARRKGSVVPRDFAVRLTPGASLERPVTIKFPGPAKGKGAFDSRQWVLMVSADLALSAGRKSRGDIVLSFSGGRGALSFREKARVTSNDFSQRVSITVPLKRVTEGIWSLSLRCGGKVPVLVDDVFVWLMPRDPRVMKFAKPNGKNGPDRLESGTMGFVAQTAHRHGPLPVVSVRPGSPAARAGLQPGDIILAVNGRPLPINSCAPGFEWFEYGHEAVLGHASVEALKRGSAVKLQVWRGQQTRELTLRLARRRPLPQDFPFDTGVTPILYKDLLSFIRRTRNRKGVWSNHGNACIQTCFSGLALLGNRDPRDFEAIHDVADWYMRTYPTPEHFGNLGFWMAAYSGIFMSEYYLATGDERVRPWIERALDWIADGFHTSKWGMPALGHGPSGLPYGQKALMAPASHVIVFEALARRAGIQSEIWETLFPFMKHSWADPKNGGHGGMGYNASYKDKNEFWSRSGLFALATHLRGQKEHMGRLISRFMLKRHPWMRNSHAYGNPGDVWGLVGLAAISPPAFREVMQAWRWSFDGAWEKGYGLRHTTAHMGSPYMGEEGLLNPAMAMLLSVRKKGLCITGARDRGWLKPRPLPSAPADIRIRFNRKGEVQVVASPAGLPLRYTLNGHAPTRRAALYSGPFALPDGGLVCVAAELQDGGMSRVFSQELGLPKSGWKLLDANGSSDPAEALRRATHLIDGDERTPWQPDLGEGQKRFPFHVTFDLGRKVAFDGLRFMGPGLPNRIKVALADQPARLSLKADALTSSPKGGHVDFRFPGPRWGRYLYVSIESLPRGQRVRFGELDPIWPQETVSRTGNVVTFPDPVPGLTLRWAGVQRKLTGASAEVKRTLTLRKGAPVQVRLFDRRGQPMGPIRILRM